MIEFIINYYYSLPDFGKIIFILLGFGLLLSIIKKLLKIAILFAILIILTIIIFKLI